MADVPRSRHAARRPAAEISVDAVLLALLAAAAFRPVLRNGFVNWDDPSVLVDNPYLGHAGAVSWAFSTTSIGHYQPLAWIVWSSMKSLFGLSPAIFHGISLAVHVANGVLVYMLTRALTEGSRIEPVQRRAASLLAGVIFLLHPASVEPVAWASAFPYVLSLFALLLSFSAYVSRRRRISIALYAVSLLTRATALGYPVVLLIVDLWVLDRRRRTSLRRLLLEKLPFVVLAAAAAAAEWYARDVATFEEIGLWPRVTMAAAAPFVYLWRTLWPVHLSPLSPLPISPTVEFLPLALGVAGVVGASAMAWRLRMRWPLVAVAWFVYITLLAPVAGLTPSGIQATADRYMYVPAVVLAMIAGVALARAMTTPRTRTAVGAAAAIAIAASGVVTWRQTHHWKDSIGLWTRAAALDPRNDVAAYNLAIALADAGRDEDAIAWYERTLVLVPDHDLARGNLAILQAARAERNGDRLAAAGRADDAAAEYARALALDPKRVHARAARGMLLMRRGQLREAATELRAALDGGARDTEVPNGLAFALAQIGETSQAARVLADAVAAHPDDVNVKHNLARLLATTPDPRVRDGATALRLALEVCERTGRREPRALDTLSAAYAAVGRFDLARATASQAADRARALGDAATAAEIEAHARSYAAR